MTFANALAIGQILPGAFAEFGVYKGQTFWRILDCAGVVGKTAYAVDSWLGMADPTEKDGGQYQKGQLAWPVKNFLVELERHPNRKYAKVCEGWIPEVLKELTRDRFAFCHVDLDQYKPTLHALNFAWARLCGGGILAMHDWFPERDTLASAAAKEFGLPDIQHQNLAEHRAYWIKP